MPRRVFECISFDTASATCTQAAWVERSDFPTLSTADALELLSAVAMVFVCAWGWKKLGRITSQ
jgi:flagellar biogenesis protein FliO